MSKKSVCWNITSKCNENCRFCYRIICKNENTYEQNKKILDILIKLKINKISWTGGECLLYPYLKELMKEANENNIKNNIITNGKLLTPDIIDEIEEYTDYITFSLDSLDSNVNEELGRGENHGQHIIELMNYIYNNNKNIKIKLNSILTEKNKQNINEIIDIAKRYPLERWKIFKFIALRGVSIENQLEFEISKECYDDVIKRIRREEIGCPVIECKEEEIQNKYLLINPVGDFLITNNNVDKLLCNFENIDLIRIKEHL